MSSKKVLSTTVVDLSDSNVSAVFEPHDRNTTGYDYSIRLYPYSASIDCTVTCTVGTVYGGGRGVGVIKNESITLNGQLEVKPKYRVIRFSEHEPVGVFFDEQGNKATPIITTENGVIKFDKAYWGTVIVSYSADYALYNYNAFRKNVGGVLLGKKYGMIVAFKDKKQIASYEIPTPENSKARFDAIVVYSEYLVQGSKQFELAPNFPDDNNYPNYPFALESSKPSLDEDAPVRERNHYIVAVEGDNFYPDTPAVTWYPPTLGEPFNGVIYKIKSNIPTSETDTVSQQLIDSLNEELERLKTKFPTE